MIYVLVLKDFYVVIVLEFFGIEYSNDLKIIIFKIKVIR